MGIATAIHGISRRLQKRRGPPPRRVLQPRGNQATAGIQSNDGCRNHPQQSGETEAVKQIQKPRNAHSEKQEARKADHLSTGSSR